MRSRAGRSGFTLVELLVVTAIIAVLVSLLLPAVQQVRESARRMQCHSHLKQFGIALHQYADVHQVFPRICLEGKGTSTYITGWQGFSVHSMLLPFLDQTNLYQQLDFNTSFLKTTNSTAKNTPVPTFLCPSDVGGKRVNGAGNNYVVSGGPSLIMLSPIPGVNAGGSPGIPIDVADQIGMFNMRRFVSSRDITDGLSNTIAASEAIIGDGDMSRYTFGDLVRGIPFPTGFPNTFASVEQLNEFGANCRANPTSHYSDPHKEWINGMPAQTAFNTLNPPNSPNPECHENSVLGWYDSRGVWSARSHHHGGVNVLLGDGSCRTIAEKINVPMWQHLGAIADGQVLGEF